MKYAVIAATAGGCRQALRVCYALEILGLGAAGGEKSGSRASVGDILGQVDIYVHGKAVADMEKLLSGQAKSNRKYTEYQRLGDLLPQLWQSYEGIVFIMATGIVVRLIAPHIVSKLSDPAILVMDDRGRNIISLLSGHVGGANRLTAYLAEALGANPVITTATDVNNLLAPDVVAGYIKAVPYPKENIVRFNGGLLRGENIRWWLAENLPDCQRYEKILQTRGVAYDRLSLKDMEAAWGVKSPIREQCTDNCDCRGQECRELPWDSPGLHVVIAESYEGLPQQENILYLHPRKLIAGVGCRRNTEKELILSALDKACQAIGWHRSRISGLASTVVKADEKGLLETAEELGISIEFYENARLAQMIEKYHLPESAFVKKTIGVGNICQASALCRAGQGTIALDKTKYEKVTVALVWQK